MTIKEQIKSLKEKSSFSHNLTETLLSRDVFRRIINRERDRANRTGEIFSLVVFNAPDSNGKQKNLENLVNIVVRSMRSIDVLGWLDDNHVGILLPETENSGAHKFVNKICTEAQSSQDVSNYEVYTYPSDILTDPENISFSRLPGDRQGRHFHWGGWSFAKTQQNVDYIFSQTHMALKRGFDFLGAGVLLLLLSPLFFVISLIIKIASPGPVFFKQERIGYGGQPFTFLKFRTMCSGAASKKHQDYLASLIRGASDQDGDDAPMTKLDHDPQIIPCGNFLRKSCLDELPQLINVLRGEMSLVGPRPPIPYEVKEYCSWHRGRFNAIPGMTGLWQVSGKNKLSFREMVRLDIRYSMDRSLFMDIKILFKTPMAILVQLKDSLKNKSSTVQEGV